MTKTLWLLLFLLPPLAHGQVNCTTATMTPTVPNTWSCPSGTGIGEATKSWLDQCSKLGSSAPPYYSQTSTVGGEGGCTIVAGTVVNCEPVNTTSVLVATQPGMPDQFQNFMYSVVLAKSGTTVNCVRTGIVSRDIKTCQAYWCTQTCITCERGYTLCGYNPVCLPSPIIVDTTGKGFRLTSAADGVRFDFSGKGKPIKTGWTAADSGDAFLACLDCWKDIPNNGKIDSGRKLFGNYTEQTCAAGARNGYCALAEFDKPENGGNGDGIIDWHDAVWPKLLLWIDANHDGVSQPNELHTLVGHETEFGVYSISLKYSDDTHEDQYGNQFHYKSALNPNPLDGASRDGHWTYDVFFAVEQSGGKQQAAECPQKPAKKFDLNDLALGEVKP